jgi:xanthine dehydrogenase YagR molybdenum-binding subunit
MAPQSMRAGDGTLIGWGVAAGAYPGLIVPTVARLKVADDGGVRLSIGGHEMGQGIRTALAAAVARKLAVPPGGVVVLVGDTRIAPQHVTAGSWGTPSAVPTARARPPKRCSRHSTSSRADDRPIKHRLKFSNPPDARRWK